MAFSSFPLSLAFFIFFTKLSENLSYAFDSFKLKSLLVAFSDKLLIFEIVSLRNNSLTCFLRERIDGLSNLVFVQSSNSTRNSSM